MKLDTGGAVSLTSEFARSYLLLHFVFLKTYTGDQITLKGSLTV